MSNWEIYLFQSTISENENINSKSKFKYKRLQYSTSHKPQNGKIKVINLGKVVMLLLLLPNDASFLTGEEQKCETAGPPWGEFGRQFVTLPIVKIVNFLL